jgi:hypothetical protein
MFYLDNQKIPQTWYCSNKNRLYLCSDNIINSCYASLYCTARIIRFVQREIVFAFFLRNMSYANQGLNGKRKLRNR